MGRQSNSYSKFGLLIAILFSFSMMGCQPAPQADATSNQLATTAVAVVNTPVVAASAEPSETLPAPEVSVVEQPTDAPTATSEPTRKPTKTATVVPTEKATETATATAEPTATATATETPRPTLTPTDSAPPTNTPEPIANPCRPLWETQGARAPYKVAAAAWERPGAWETEIYTGGTGYKMIHLGFDVEGQPAHLGALLDVLDKHSVKTTMFVVGNWSQAYPGWIQNMANRGHEFANHTWSHANMRDLDADQVKQELNDTEQLIQSLTGRTTKPWFRPPFGSRSDVSLQAAYEAGWTHVIWSGSAEDWREGTTAERMCATLKDGAYPGSILYSHTSNPDIVEVVDRFISEMHAAGYTFVPLSVMMSSNPGNYLISQ